MSLFNVSTATDASATDAGISVDSVFNGLVTVFSFFRQIIDFLKSFLTPLFESVFSSLADKTEDFLDE